MPLTERLSSRVAAEVIALAGSEPRGVPAVIDTNVVLDLIYWEDPHSEDLRPLKSSKAPTNYFTPNILRKSWSRLVVSVVHLDALAFPVAAT